MLLLLLLVFKVVFISHHFIFRDFSNGYLIAEIFSWYYPQEIQMHMFQNGTSIESKIGNWALLQKVMSFKFYQFVRLFLCCLI